MTNRETCATHCTAHKKEHQRLKRLHRVIGNARLFGVLVALGLLWLIETHWPAFSWLALASLGAAFIGSSVGLARIEFRSAYARLAELFYRRNLQGIAPVDQGDMQPAKLPTHPNIRDDHPFASDIDLLEPEGLFNRLNFCATSEGARHLAGLLATPANIRTIGDRQSAVRELAPELALRERLFVEGTRRSPFIRTDSMLRWASKEPSEVPPWIPATCVALSLSMLFSVVALALNPSIGIWAWVLGSVSASLVFRRVASERIKVPALEAEAFHVDFSQLLGLVSILESQEFESSNLQQITELIRDGEDSASEALGRIRRIISLYEDRRNQFVAILGPLVLYETHLSLMVEKWRVRHASRLPDWILAVAKLEAFSSLAGFAYVREGYVFPELCERGPLLRARELGHPLLGDAAVGNDLFLDPEHPILVASGANMAGKSTLLRTIGVNLSLAYAGAPVQAASMAISDLVLVTSIRVADSLQRGDSRFSAELQRIQLMLESVRSGRHTLLLIDELYGGTNSYDRYAGAVALGEYLLDFDSVLAVFSTHDRNVTRWAEEHSPRVTNAHFRDVVDDGKMTFDYRLHDGPATHGNAVELMRLSGIPVRRDREAFPP